MKKILGLVISQRKLGNSEILVKEIMNNIPADYQPELIRLTDLKIQPCNACYKCLQPNQQCTIKDDFNFIFEKIKQADAIIIAVPVYLLGPHGYYKMLSDRMVSAFKFVAFTAGKPCILVVPYGSQGWEGYTKSAALVMPKLLQMKVIDFWQIRATLPGESLRDPANLEYARRLGQTIFDRETYIPGIRECPYCGSDLFRLLPGNKIECPICSVTGSLQADNIPSFATFDNFRFSATNIAEHFDGWVKDMKKKFQVEKGHLKEVQKMYRDKDWWIKP